ncbi:MAG: hypothetical protein JST08_14405 [Actinobacteria bacterium]|nr:hypothetical protein [Actinomycetota bacterium]
MNTRKSLGFGLVIGLLAMAFAALPAMAGAAQLTDANGSVEVGETVTATSKNAVTNLGLAGELTCEHVVVNGVVTANSGGKVTIAMDEAGSDSATGCKLKGGPVSVAPTLTSINLSGSTGTAVFDFTVGGSLESSKSTVSWVSPATSVHVAGPVEGPLPGTFSGDFTISDEAGPVTLD